MNGLNAGAKYPKFTIPKQGDKSKVWRHFKDGQYLGENTFVWRLAQWIHLHQHHHQRHWFQDYHIYLES